jgi:hypothetical protein
MAVTRRAYAGGAAQTTISSAIDSDDGSISIASATGWPSGAPFYVVIDPGQPAEEKVLVSSRSGTTLTLSDPATQRGVDGTAASSHPGGAEIYPVITATDLNEANLLASTMTTRGDLLYQGASDPARLAKGTQNHVLRAGASDPEWGQVVAASIATGAVEEAKIASAAVTTAKIADANVTTAKIADANVTTAKIVDLNVTTGKLADTAVTTAKITDANVTTAKIADSNVTTGKIADGAVTSAKLATAFLDTLPKGYIASSTKTSSQTLTGSGPHDITGMTATFTAVANRRYKISLVQRVSGATDGSVWAASIYEDTTFVGNVGRFSSTDAGNDGTWTYSGFAIHTPSAGSVTYKLQISRPAGSGNLTAIGNLLDYSYFLIEDIGPS